MPLAHSIHASGLVNIFANARELAPAHPPLAHSINASGLVNIFVYARELAPAHPPLAFAVTPPGWLDYALMRISNARPRGFLFLFIKWYGRLSQPSVPPRVIHFP